MGEWLLTHVELGGYGTNVQAPKKASSADTNGSQDDEFAAPGDKKVTAFRPADRQGRGGGGFAPYDRTGGGSKVRRAQEVTPRYSDAKVAIETVGISGGRSLATPADSPRHDCSPHMYAANVWDLSIVQGPFSVAPCPTFALRFATFASL
jgi:hypothetical protein